MQQGRHIECALHALPYGFIPAGHGRGASAAAKGAWHILHYFFSSLRHGKAPDICGTGGLRPPRRGSRSLLYSRAKFREDDAMGAAPSQKSRLNCLQAAPSLRVKQGALHNASFRRGIGRVFGMCRSLSLCCTVSRRRPVPPGRSPRLPRPRGYTHGNGR